MIKSNNNTHQFIHFGPRYCIKCRNNSIEIFDFFNNPMYYASVITAYEYSRKPLDEILGNRVIYRMRCRKCGTNYNIRWDEGYPLPDLYECNKDNALFIDSFKHCNALVDK